MDALRAIPSWRQQEEILGTLLTLREKTTGTVIVQTRTTDNDVLEYAEKGHTAKFYDEELASRETFHYPPYQVFIHLTWKGDKKAVEEMATHIESLFRTENIALYGPPLQEEKVIRQGLLRIPAQRWPDDMIVDKLRSLPPSVRIMINPDRIV